MTNTLYYGDNLEVLREYVPSESVDLIYLDPPFNSNRNYNVLFKERSGISSPAQMQAFTDTWTWDEAARDAFDAIQRSAPPDVSTMVSSLRRYIGDNDMMAYLVMMTERLIELHRVLKSTGSLYLHCDPTASHYLKILLDTVFGPKNFRNEIIWKRYSSHNDSSQGTRHFGRIHDSILFYSKTEKPQWTQTFTEYDQAYIDESYASVEEGSERRYTTSPLTGPGGAAKGNPVYEWNGHTRAWRYSKETMQKLHDEGRLHYSGTGYVRQKRYLDEAKGVPTQDLWIDISSLSGAHAERLGYPTQKPLALLERIIQASSKPGDVVLDPFCGCGTAVSAAQKLDRQWLGIDITFIAVDLIEKRLIASYGEAIRKTFEVRGIPRDLDGARRLFRQSPFDFQRWAVSLVDGTLNERMSGDQGIDGVIRFPLEARSETGECVVSVKGGMQRNPSMVRDLIGTVNAHHAEMGLMITMAEPTSGMIQASQAAGGYVWPVNHRMYPRVQIASVPDLLAEKGVRMPTPFLPYFKAQRISLDRQPRLFS